MSTEDRIEVVRVAASLREKLRAAAAARGISFADEAHRRFIIFLGLGSGETLLVGGKPRTLARKRWQAPRLDSRGLLHVRENVRGRLVALARENGWPLSDQVNDVLEKSLSADGA